MRLLDKLAQDHLVKVLNVELGFKQYDRSVRTVFYFMTKMSIDNVEHQIELKLNQQKSRTE